MKTAVVYASYTGHSPKIAKAVAEGLGVPALKVSKNMDLSGIDLLFIVGGIYASNSHPKLVSLAQSLDSSKVKKAALITSCSGGFHTQAQVREALKAKGVEVVEKEFICLGSFLWMMKGHPNTQEIADAAAFAKTIIAEDAN